MIKIKFKAKDADIISEIKQKFSKPDKDPTAYPSSYVLEDGTIVAMGSKESDKYGYGKMEHQDFDKYLKDRGYKGRFEDYANVVRLITRGLTVEVPAIEPTTEQYAVLETWINYVRSGFKEYKIGVGVYGEPIYKYYNTDVHSLTYIIGRIKRYYTSGKLLDSLSWGGVYSAVKNEFGITMKPPRGASYILPGGTFLNLEQWFREYDGTEENDHDDQEREELYKGLERWEIDWNKIQPGSFAMHSLVQYYINMKLTGRGGNVDTGDRLHDDDDTLMEHGCIKINSGETLYDNLYVNLPRTRPTNAALNALEEYLFEQFYHNDKDKVAVFTDGHHWATGKYTREEYPDPADIIKKITAYYGTGRLEK